MSDLNVGDQVIFLDRPGNVGGTIRSISTEPHRTEYPIEVQLIPGRADSRFWFARDELRVVALRGSSDPQP
jgi:hypothetical protein